jgi:Flp pilus assembly protein TadG
MSPIRGDGERGQEMRTHAIHNKGQALVEFALVVPILLLLMVGIMEFSRGWMTKNILTGAAREGARAAAVGEDGSAAANRVLDAARINPAIVTVTLPAPHVPGLPREAVTVRVTYNFPVSVPGFLPGWSAATIRLESTTTMLQEY